MSWVLFLLLGAFAGLMAGLLGVGGGLVIVPVLIILLKMQGISQEVVVHMAIGTSLAAIAFSALSSIYTHHAKQAVNWKVLQYLAPGLVLGAWSGAYIADALSGPWLQTLFGLFAIGLSVQMLKQQNTAENNADFVMPAKNNLFLSGTIFGAISAIFGIGGGSLVVPYLVHFKARMQQAIGTSAAAGLPIALAGASGIMLRGCQNENLPEQSVGYVYLPALLAIVVTSFPCARLGALWAHRLPAKQLKRIFALLLVLVGVQLSWSGVLGLL